VVKIKSLCLTKYHAMKTYRGTRWGEWLALHPDRFTPSTHWAGDWEGSRASLDAVAKKENPIIIPAGNSTPGRPARSLVTVLTDTAAPSRYVD